MSRLRAVGRWLLVCWPLAMRSTLERQERRLRVEIRHQELNLMSLARELVRQGEHHEAALREVDDLTGRLAAAVRDRDEARMALVSVPSEVLRLRHQLRREHATALVRENQLAAAEGRPVVEVDA